MGSLRLNLGVIFALCSLQQSSNTNHDWAAWVSLRMLFSLLHHGHSPKAKRRPTTTTSTYPTTWGRGEAMTPSSSARTRVAIAYEDTRVADDLEAVGWPHNQWVRPQLRGREAVKYKPAALCSGTEWETHNSSTRPRRCRFRQTRNVVLTPDEFLLVQNVRRWGMCEIRTRYCTIWDHWDETTWYLIRESFTEALFSLNYRWSHGQIIHFAKIVAYCARHSRIIIGIEY